MYKLNLSLLLILSLCLQGCVLTDRTKCLQFNGGSPLHGAYLLDEWGKGGYFKVMDDTFWTKGYSEGYMVKFKTKGRLYNSGEIIMYSVKYVGDCDE